LKDALTPLILNGERKKGRKMNIKKMAQMAQDKNPNRFLAQLSIYWTEQNNKGNPVESATHLLNHRLFRRINILALLLYGIVVAILKLPMSKTNGDGSIWLIVWLVLGGALFVEYVSCWNSESGTSFNEMFDDGEAFIKAISELEKVLGKPLDQWTDADNVQEMALAYLKKKADAVKAAEKIEEAEMERKPWGGVDTDKMAWPHRYSFESSFELLIKLLPLPKDKGVYYGNKVQGTNELPTH
jgi:uncharacterized membrane protein